METLRPGFHANRHQEKGKTRTLAAEGCDTRLHRANKLDFISAWLPPTEDRIIRERTDRPSCSREE
jgi:hypothetical protein